MVSAGEKWPTPDQRARKDQTELLIEQLKHVTEGLAATFAPFCEVVLHDLGHPDNAILAIHNNLSKRQIGAPATELRLARIADPDYPQVIANDANVFADGRQAKGTSIGIKNANGDYIAALCLNIDRTLFQNLQSMIGQFTAVGSRAGLRESLNPAGAEGIRTEIDRFAARLATTPCSLNMQERRALLGELRQAGFLELRRAVEVIAAHLGVSRTTVYSDAK